MAATHLPRRRTRRKPTGIYLNGVCLDDAGLPLESRVGSLCSMRWTENNHALLVKPDQILITTRVQTVLSLYAQGVLGAVGAIYRVAVGGDDLGEAAFVGMMLLDDGRHDRIRLTFSRIHPAEV